MFGSRVCLSRKTSPSKCDTNVVAEHGYFSRRGARGSRAGVARSRWWRRGSGHHCAVRRIDGHQSTNGDEDRWTEHDHREHARGWRWRRDPLTKARGIEKVPSFSGNKSEFTACSGPGTASPPPARVAATRTRGVPAPAMSKKAARAREAAAAAVAAGFPTLFLSPWCRRLNC